MSNERKDRSFAAITVSGGNPPTIDGNDGGVSAIAHNGVGDYQITLVNGIAEAECVVLFGARGAATRAQRCVHTSATSKQIVSDIGGAAAETSFCMSILRIAP